MLSISWVLQLRELPQESGSTLSLFVLSLDLLSSSLQGQSCPFLFAQKHRLGFSCLFSITFGNQLLQGEGLSLSLFFIATEEYNSSLYTYTHYTCNPSLFLFLLLCLFPVTQREEIIALSLMCTLFSSPLCVPVAVFLSFPNVQ